jgi:iron-sulfur cluster assembly protein
MNTHTQNILSFTSTALEELKNLMAQPDFNSNHKLRVGVKGGGCSGLSYVLGFDDKEDDDELYEIQGIQVIIKKAHLMYLEKMEVDYGKGLDARGFIFNNPNASSTCGCGTSFAV